MLAASAKTVMPHSRLRTLAKPATTPAQAGGYLRLLQNGQPRPGFSRLGLSSFGKKTCKPNSVVCGHSSRRHVTADAHQRPTRRFRHLLEPPGRIGPMRSAAWLLALSVAGALPSLFGLAPCGVYPASGFTAGAVRSYRTISPLPRRESWTEGLTLPAGPYALETRGSRGGIFSVALAVRGP